jgi:hypothetical protein
MTMRYARRVERGRRQDGTARMKVSTVRSLDGMPWLPLYRVQGQGTYKEESSSDHAIMSPREEN